MKRPLSVVMLACALATGTAMRALAAAANSTYSAPITAETAALTPQERALLTSSAPKTILLNPATGDMVSVTANTSELAAAISNHSPCNAGDGCYLTNKTPYADQGFTGAGTNNGSWPDRNGYSSGKWTVSACWAGRCGPKISPGTDVEFTTDVTGTSFRVS